MAQGYSSTFSWVIFSLLLLLLEATLDLCCWSIRQLGGKTVQVFVNNHVRNKACSALSPVLGDDDLECAELFPLVNCFILHNGLTPEINFLLGILRNYGFMEFFFCRENTTLSHYISLVVISVQVRDIDNVTCIAM